MKDISTLRDHLFDQIARLTESDGEQLKVEIQRASSIIQVSEEILKTAKTEADIIQQVRKLGSDFIPFKDQTQGLKVLPHEEIKKLGKVVSEQNRNRSKEKMFDPDSQPF
jgi:hypothetical protein